MWTEILSEQIAVTHVGDAQVLVPLADDVDQRAVEAAKDALEHRAGMKRMLEDLRALRKELEDQQQVCEFLAANGYDPSEIPR